MNDKSEISKDLEKPIEYSWSLSEIFINFPSITLDLIDLKLLSNNRVTFSCYTINHIVRNQEIIYPLEIAITEYAKQISDKKLNLSKRFLLLSNILRSGIVHNVYSRFGNKRNLKLLIDNSYPILDYWLDDLTLSNYSLPRKYTLGEYENNGKKIFIPDAILSVCKNCSLKYNKLIFDDNLCRKNVHGRNCKKEYVRDFIKPLCGVVETSQNDLIKILFDITIKDARLLEKHLNNLRKLTSKISLSFVSKLRTFSVIKDKQFMPYTEINKVTTIPASKVSKYEKQLKHLIHKDEDLENAFYTFLTSNPRLPLYEAFRLQRKYVEEEYLRTSHPVQA